MRTEQGLDPRAHLRLTGAGRVKVCGPLLGRQRGGGGEDVFLVDHGSAGGAMSVLLFHARSGGGSYHEPRNSVNSNSGGSGLAMTRIALCMARKNHVLSGVEDNQLAVRPLLG